MGKHSDPIPHKTCKHCGSATLVPMGYSNKNPMCLTCGKYQDEKPSPHPKKKPDD